MSKKNPRNLTSTELSIIQEAQREVNERTALAQDAQLRMESFVKIIRNDCAATDKHQLRHDGTWVLPEEE